MSKVLKQALGLAMLAAMTNMDYQKKVPSTLMGQPKHVKKVIPKGAKVWPQYGNVVAINETNAKRKFNRLKNK